MHTHLVRIIIDPTVEPGKYVIGGVRLVEPGDDAALGRELRTKEAKCHSEQEAAALRVIVARTEGMELTE